MPLPRPTAPAAIGISRRAVLQGSAAALTMLALGPLFGRAALAAPPTATPTATLAATPEADFLRLSSFLTGKSLDPVLSTRYLVALNRHNPDLGAEIAALQGYIDRHALGDMDSFLAQPDLPADLRASAQKIVAAWYLGVVGEPEVAELIAYADALMYGPTNPYIPVPTYGPGPHSWGPDIIPGAAK